MKSLRLPGKALLSLVGRPVLWHLMERVLRARHPSKTVICTSTDKGDDPIVDFAKENNYEVFRGHTEDVLSRFIEVAEMHRAHHIVRITGDNPLTDPELIDKMIEFHVKENAEFTYTEDTPRGTRPEIISVDALLKCYERAENSHHTEYLKYYFMNNPETFRLVKYCCDKDKYIRPYYKLTIDALPDFKVVEKLFKEIYTKNPKFNLSDIIDYFDQHAEIKHDERIKVPPVFSRYNFGMKKDSNLVKGEKS